MCNFNNMATMTGEIRAGFILSGKTYSSSGTFYQSSDVNYSSSVNSTPERSSLPRTSSSDSFQSIDTLHPQDEMPPSHSFAHDAESKDSSHDTSPFSLLDLISAWLPRSILSSFGKSDTKEVNTAEENHGILEDADDLSGRDEGLVPLSFFEDDGSSEPYSQEDLPAPLGGGTVLAGTYAVSAKALNGILFRPGSQFLRDLADLQKTTQLTEGPWRIIGDQDKPKRVVSYVKAATRLVKSVTATEDQVYSRADEKGFVLNVYTMIPDAPYGKTFRVDLQYCIFAGADTGSGEKTSFLRVSWGIQFLSSTMMKGIIESGTRQGLQDSYKDFEQVLTKHVGPQQRLLDAAVAAQQARANVDVGIPKSDWQLAKEYFCNLRVLMVLSSSIVILLHIYISRPCPKSGLEVWKLDFPDTLREFVTSAILGVQIERIFVTARKLLGARLYKGLYARLF